MTVLCKAARDFSKSFMWILLECPFLLKSIFSFLSVCKWSLTSTLLSAWHGRGPRYTLLVASNRMLLPAFVKLMAPELRVQFISQEEDSHFSQGCFYTGNYTVSFIATMFHILAKCFYNENSELFSTLKQLLYYSVCLLPRSINRWLSYSK